MHRIARYTGHRGAVYTLSPGATPGTFLSGSGDGTVVRWHAARPDLGEMLVRVDQAVFSLCLLPERDLLLIGTEGGRLHALDMVRMREARLFGTHRKGVFRIVPLPGGRVACAGGDGVLSVWRAPDPGGMELERHIPLTDGKLRDLAPAPGGDILAVACSDGKVRLLDTGILNEKGTIAAHGSDTLTGAMSTAFHPSKPVLLSGGKDGHLRLWHGTGDHRALLDLPAHKGSIYRIAFSPDGAHCATASRDRTALLWDASTMEPLHRLDGSSLGHTRSVNDLLWMDGTLFTASDDRSIMAWRET